MTKISNKPLFCHLSFVICHSSPFLLTAFFALTAFPVRAQSDARIQVRPQSSFDQAANAAPGDGLASLATGEAAAPTVVGAGDISFYLWSRQAYETRKSQELLSMLERILGAGKAGVHIQYEWPPLEPGARVNLEPSKINALVVTGAEADHRVVENLAVRILGIAPDRGDAINVYRVAAHNGLKELLFSPQGVLDLIKLFVVILLGWAILMTVSRSTSQISASLQMLATTTRTHDVDVTLSPKASPLAGAVRPVSRLGFGQSLEMGVGLGVTFNQADPELLAKVLEQENSRQIAIFISTLESDIAGKVLSNLPPSKQEEVALTLPQMVEPDPREVAQLQAQLHLKLRKLTLEKK